MGTWGIAQEMAKLNEQNLSRLEGNGRFSFKRLRELGLRLPKKELTYLVASEEQLAGIRSALQASKKADLLKERVLGLILALGGLVGLIAMLTTTF